ncbi:MAG TPA: LptA/OstA family protein [Myxococcales bacterium]|nr:LptA/OstA family protein [Myxococcales bacterium]
MSGALLWLAAAAATAPPRRDVPVQVRCDDMVVENREALARCEGHVTAVRQNVVVTSERAVARYDDGGRITELTCLGHVHVIQKLAPPGKAALQRTADGDRAVYREASRTLTLTGHAQLQQPNDRLVGEPIVFYLDEDRVTAKGAKLVGKPQDAQQDGKAHE